VQKGAKHGQLRKERRKVPQEAHQIGAEHEEN